MKYVFLIGTEHQLFQVDIAINYFNIESKDIFLIIQDINLDNKLSEKLISNSKYGTIFCFDNWVFKDFIINKKKIKNFIKICYNILKLEETINFFSSHYSDDSTLLFLSIINPNNYLLMDEGTASFSVLERRDKKDYFFKMKLIVKSYLYKINIKEPTTITYFTKFNFNEKKEDKKEIYTEKKYNNTASLIDNNKFDFLGSSAVELNLISEKNYLCYLNQIIELYKKKEMRYFMHRNERESKLIKIKEMGFVIIENKIPFEKFYQEQSILPEILGSFFTTSVLINISYKFENLPKLKVFVFPLVNLKKERPVYTKIIRILETDKNIEIIKIN